MDKRPELTPSISVGDFKDFYWLKEELIHFCRTEGLHTSGGKLEVAERIEVYLATGQEKERTKKARPSSTFNWKSEQLSLDTLITDNYKNSENVRAFFEQHIGKQFKFNVRFMNWMKSNIGKSLRDAIHQYEHFLKERQMSSVRKKIAPQFEYNTYLRDFLDDNPGASRELAIQLWNIKKTLRGSKAYSKDDLDLLKKE